MKKRERIESEFKIAVDIIDLSEMLGVGRTNAEKIGTAAGAVIRVGRRKLYNVEKVKAYMNNLTEVQE